MSRSCLFAVICLFLSGPILLVKLPWFIPTIEALKATVTELGIEGTSAYKDHLLDRLRREIFATCIYFVGLLSVVGLFGIATNFIRGIVVDIAVWFGVLLASSGLLIFELSSLASNATYGYMIVFLGLPLSIVFLSGVAFFLSLRACVSERSMPQN